MSLAHYSMHILLKGVKLFIIATVIIAIWLIHKYDIFKIDNAIAHSTAASHKHNYQSHKKVDPNDMVVSTGSLNFSSGISETDRSKFTRTLVTACVDKKEVSWMREELLNVNLSVYVANDLSANMHPPKNKGHEAIIYLTYIIDHYATLPDIVIFMHAHRWAEHNNEVLDYDAVQMIQRLSSTYVRKQGYVNMRCDWVPGCPEWLHPSSKQEDLKKQEEAVLSKCWGELFPLDPLPWSLAQACCAQFAVSQERILSIPLSQFIFYRDWMLATPLSNYISGRIWEYLWHFVFTGEHLYCPAQHLCYCDGFGICFGGDESFDEFARVRDAKERWESEMKTKHDAGGPVDSAWNHDAREQIRRLGEKLFVMKNAALEQNANFTYYQ